MEAPKPTLAIYGIQDRDEYEHPVYVRDHNLCIMQNGRVRDFLLLERLTRRPSDNRLHLKLADLLKQQKLLAEDFDLVFVDSAIGRSLITKQGNVRFEAPLNRILAAGAEEGNCWWFGRPVRARALNHELAHVFSCLPFCGSFKPNSLLVHFDLGASQSNFSAWQLKNNRLVKISAHWDYRFLTSIFTTNELVRSVIGTKPHEQAALANRFTALATHGNYRFELETWLRENAFFEDARLTKAAFFRKVKKDWTLDLRSFDSQNRFLQDCLATLHEIFTAETVRIFRRLQRETLTSNLYYSGDFALDAKTNNRLVEARLFDDLFIAPCSGDLALSLGAAAFAEWEKHGRVEVHSPCLVNWGLPQPSDQAPHKQAVAQVARALAQGKIVAVCNGQAEITDYPLGNRSLLAVAGNRALAEKVNQSLLKREWYRPLAPVMLEKNACSFTGLKTINPLSRFGLLEFRIRAEKQAELSGAVQENGAARLLCLSSRADNPFMWDLLTLLDTRYGIRALINAPFALPGEPLVHSEADARKAAAKMPVDLLVINGKIADEAGS